MKCAWQSFISILPIWMRDNVDKQGRDNLQELRLRLNSPPEIITQSNSKWLDGCVSQEDLQFCVNMASRYSPWASVTTGQGFLTAPGGHRIGLCGKAITHNRKMDGVHPLSSLCIRAARDFHGIAEQAMKYSGSILIIGKPGSGKTTLLRDLIRQKSNHGTRCIAVVDEREEIFPYVHNKPCFSTGTHTDVLSGCSKTQGIEMVLRNMGPEMIAVDEITAAEDCEALLHAGWCGVKLLATAHAGNLNDLINRPIYQPIINSGIFDTVLIMESDKTWKAERMIS